MGATGGASGAVKSRHRSSTVGHLGVGQHALKGCSPVSQPGSSLPPLGPIASDAIAAVPLAVPLLPQLIAVCAVPFLTVLLGPDCLNPSRGVPYS